MQRVYTCLATQHDWSLVLLAGAVCFLTSFAALNLFQRARASDGATRTLWLVTIAAAIGYGVWATHFIAMLAYNAGVPVGYDLALTVLSLLASAAVTGAGLAVAAETRSFSAAPIGGAIFGLGVAIMHYTGMAAMQIPGQVSWSLDLVLASIALGVLFGIASLSVAVRGEGVAMALIAATLLTLSTLSLHFTGMGALEIIPDPVMRIAEATLSAPVLSISIASAAAALLGISLVAALADSSRQKLIARTMQERASEAAREVVLAKRRETELDRTRRSAEKAEQRLATAIGAMSEGFAIFDEDDRLVMANRANLDLHRGDADEMLPGARFEDLLRASVARGIVDLEGAEPEQWIAGQLEARETGANAETVVRFANGRWMLRRERRTPQGERVGIRTDITAFKQHEQALREARENAEAADRAKSEFVAMVSHEIRTPINGIMGFNQLMLMGELSEQQRERAEIIKASSLHLLHLVNNLLDLAKIASDSIELDPHPFGLAELLAETVLSLMPLAQTKGLALSSGSALAPRTTLVGDAARIKQVLINLIGNAIKFTPSGSVTLSVSERDEGILFEVADTGTGIPQDRLEEIFDRFSQLGGPSDRAQGTGLGLAITKRLIDLMDGTVGVTSEVGKGSMFSVWLPLPRLGAPATSEAGEDAAAPQARSGHEFDVLVAEDHPASQALMSEILASIGCRVCMAANGREALDRLDAADFDLIIMDNQMPVMNGIEAIGLIRARTDWKVQIPIIALTASAMRGSEKAYAAIGVDEFMSKPVDIGRVIASVRRLGEIGRHIRDEARSTAV